MTVIELTQTYSAPELYALGKIKKYEKELLFLKTSTKVKFNDKNLAGIIKDDDSERGAAIPILNIKSITLLKYKYNFIPEKFLQKLFNTEDNLEEIVKTLARLGNIEDPKEIIISTPKREYRKEKPDRYVGIYFGKKILHIDLYTQ